MPSSNIFVNQIAQDSNSYIWASGQNLRRFIGNTSVMYDHTNSAIPQRELYYHDTRCLTIDCDDNVWCGVAGSNSDNYDLAIFYINANNPNIGKKWNLSDISIFEPNKKQEVSLIYWCPFDDSIIVFITELNGGVDISFNEYTRTKNVTSGRLFKYSKITNVWKEVIPGYTWPHIYNIKSKPDLKYNHIIYLGTDIGLYVLPTLDNIKMDSVFGVENIFIKDGILYNSAISNIISDKVYSIDLDENNNLWIGGDKGFSFFNGISFYNEPTNKPVTNIKYINNGNVFYSEGDGEINDGTGISYFNGYRIKNYINTLPNENILSMELIRGNKILDNIEFRDNTLVILCYNNLSYFSYDIPYIKATAKNDVSNGWFFTDHKKSQGYKDIVKIDNHTWVSPEWINYDTELIKNAHSTIDPDNLFLDANLSDIITGDVNKPEYWINSIETPYDEIKKEESLGNIEFLKFLSNDNNIFKINSITSRTNITTKYYIGGYINASNNFKIGITPDGVNIELPSISKKTGIIVSYGEEGYIDSYILFESESESGENEVHDIILKDDDLYVSGIFNSDIKIGTETYYGENSFYICKIAKELGSITNFDPILSTNDITSTYRILKFRYFASGNDISNISTKIDINNYDLNLILNVDKVNPEPLIFTENSIDIIKNNLDFKTNIFNIKFDILTFKTILIDNIHNTNDYFIIDSIKCFNTSNLFTGYTNKSIFSLNHPDEIHKNPFYLLIDTDNNIKGNIFDTNNENSIISFKRESTYWISVLCNKDQSIDNNYFSNNTPFILNINLNNNNSIIDSFIVELDNINDITNIELNNTLLYKNNDFISIYNDIINNKVTFIKYNKYTKLDVNSIINFNGYINTYLDFNENLFICGDVIENTEGFLEINGNYFYSILEKYQYIRGLNLGDITSHNGTGSWKWNDIHTNNKYLEAPLLSTIIFSNYLSDIKGKNNNRWILYNGDKEIIDIKNTSSFIYTFNEPGNYTIYNTVNDSMGNVYEISKPGFIKIIDHKEKNITDINLNEINSLDYEHLIINNNINYDGENLAESITLDEIELSKNIPYYFGNDLYIENNPDATFNLY